jgi:hypothetical protein
MIVSCSPEHEARLRGIADEHDMTVWSLGETINHDFELSLRGESAIRTTVAELRAAYSGQLESQLVAEVVTA